MRKNELLEAKASRLHKALGDILVKASEPEMDPCGTITSIDLPGLRKAGDHEDIGHWIDVQDNGLYVVRRADFVADTNEVLLATEDEGKVLVEMIAMHDEAGT
jgi:hypothetical protein